MEYITDKKNRIKLISLLVLICLLTLGGIMIFGKQDGYRTIKIFEITGRVGVVNNGVEYEAYPGMILTEGYSIVTSSDSSVRLVLDGDKFIKLEEGSKATFEKLGMLGTGKTTINLERGAILSEIVHSLSSTESFIVNTPNTVLAVRGTLFKVEVNVNDKGESNTNVFTYGGAVGSKRIEPNGNIIDEQVIIDAGYKTTVKMDDDETIYVVEGVEEGTVTENREPINVLEISDEDMVDIYFAAKNGHEMFIPTEEIEEELELRGVEVSEQTSVYTKADSIDTGKVVTSIDDGDFLVVDNDVENDNISGEDGDVKPEDKPDDKTDNKPDNKPSQGVVSDGQHRHKKLEVVVEATCTEEGKITATCEDCGEFMSERILAKLGHEEAEPTIIKKATCLEEGLQETYCSRCEALVSEEAIPVSEHNEVAGGALDVHSKCMDCGSVISATHTYSDNVSKESTCKEEGELTHACDCGYSYVEAIAKGEHKEKTTTVAATCTKDGKETVSCEFCGEVYKENTIPATGHIREVDGGKEGSHIECAGCGTVLSTKHSYTETIIKQATCESNGTLKYACACGYSYTKEIVGGTHVKANANAAQTTCSGCGTKLIDFDSKNFPDSEFFSLLKADGIDKNSDGLLEEVEIKTVQDLRYHYAGISDFTGLEHFTELTYLELIGNNASKIPFENLSKLELLNLSYTNITSADVIKLTNLSNLQLAGTGISSIDLSKNTKLEYLSLADCSNLTSLDLSNNKSLIHVQLQSTGISDFQIAGYSYLEEVWLTNSNIEKVRITDCPKLTRIEMPNGTSAVDISGCTSLMSIDVSNIKNTLYMFEANNCGLRGVVDLSYCQTLQIVEMNNCKYITAVNVSDCYTLSTLSVKDGSALYVDASNCLALNFPEVSDNVYYAGSGAETVDYSQVEGFNIWGVTVISGGSYSEGVFTFNEGSTMIVYNYYLTNDAYGQFIIMAE